MTFEYIYGWDSDKRDELVKVIQRNIEKHFPKEDMVIRFCSAYASMHGAAVYLELYVDLFFEDLQEAKEECKKTGKMTDFLSDVENELSFKPMIYYG